MTEPYPPTLKSAALFLVLVLAGCDLTAPSEGVTLYPHADYGGSHYNFLGDVASLHTLEEHDCDRSGEYSGWNDCASSIRVAEGWQAIIYEHTDFEGDSLVVRSDIPDLRNRGSSGTCVPPIDFDVLDLVRDSWNDCISSIRVKPSE